MTIDIDAEKVNLNDTLNLLVEDYDELRNALLKICRLEGHNIIGTSSVKEAIDVLNRGLAIKTILCDWRLTDGTGEEVINSAITLYPGADKIIVTGYNDKNAYTYAKDNDIQIIQKPISVDVMLGIIS